MKAIPVEVTFKKTRKTASMLVPVHQLAIAMMPGYDGDSTKRITAMSVRAVRETVNYIEEVTGEKPDKSCMAALELLEAGVTDIIVWSNDIRIYRNE